MSSDPILVVDDDSAILELIAQVLIDEGYNVLTASDGHTALALARNRLPKLILLDLMMPEMNGWQVVTLLKSAARTRSIPILLLSARRDMNITAQELGVSDYLAKPFDLDELLGYVENILNRSNSAQFPH